MRWLDANKVKRIEFPQNEVLLYIIKKYKLNMKYRAVKLVEQVNQLPEIAGIQQID